MTGLSSAAATAAPRGTLLSLLSLRRPAPLFVDAAAGYPLVRDSMIFNPLACNAGLSSADCASATLESIVYSTPADATQIVIPCGTCAALATSDGGTLNLNGRMLNIEGKLHVPSSSSAVVVTTGIVVQGEFVVDPPDGFEGLKVELVGTDDILFEPHAENLDRCGEHGHCNISSKPVVVMGGRLDIRGDALTASSACKTWTTLKDVDTTDPILPGHPGCAFDGGLLPPNVDGTFASRDKTGFTRSRVGGVSVVDDLDESGDVVNSYIRLHGRGDARDGLQFRLGDHANCAMRNRMYRFSIRYRLNVADGSGHSPHVQLDHTNHNIKTLAHLNLPPSVGGGWAHASFDFLSYDLVDEAVSQIRITWPYDETFADADFDDISILPILRDPPGTPDVFFVEPEVARCWLPKVGAKLLITSNEIGSRRAGWNEEDVAVITDIDAATGAITVDEPIPHYKTTELQDARFATEVAILHRSTVFAAADDNIDEPWIGGHSAIMHTTAPQVLSGAAFVNFGQQGRLGKYPIHFHMAGDHPDSVISKNLVQDSNQRCVVIHGTDSILVEENVAYNTTGHCFINENGVEEDIRFYNNLGVLTQDQPEERRIGDPLESDHRAYTFWFTNANVKVVGNVAAGAEKGGFWYETFEQGPHGPYKDWPEYADFNPKTRRLGSFVNNAVHSSGERGIRMYEPGYKPFEPFTFYDTRAYKSNDHGIFIHGVQYMTLDGGVFADNKISIRNFNARTVFKNLEIVLTSRLVHERNPTHCHGKAGLQQKINPGWNDGAILENVTFSGLNVDGAECDARGFEWYHLLGEKRFVGNTHVSDVGMAPGTERKDLVNFACRWAEDPYDMHNLLLEDTDGTIGLTGRPGFYASKGSLATAFVPDATCEEHPRGCAQYCEDVCLQNLEVKNVKCGPLESCLNYTMRISDGATSFDYSLHEDKADDNKHRYEAILPKGRYEITFYDQDGNLDDEIEPSDIEITLGDRPRCADHLEEESIGLRTDAPTQHPTTVPPLEPLYSDSIISPLDQIVKLGEHRYTNDPQEAIGVTISNYQVYGPDKDLPTFMVTPTSQHTCSIVQGLKVYTSERGTGRDPTEYLIEGRFGIGNEWSLLSQGALELPSDRNVAGENVADASNFDTATFPRNVRVFREYRLRLWGTTSSWMAVGHVQLTGYFVACNFVMPQPTGSPTAKPSTAPSLRPSLRPTTSSPSSKPSGSPTSRPSKYPSLSPTTKPTTSSPTKSPSNKPTIPPTPPIYSSSILAPGDSLVKHGMSGYTLDPSLAIDGVTNTYALWKGDFWHRPAFDVTPMSHPGKATIVQELRIYRDGGRSNTVPTSYKIEGRQSSSDDWIIISEGSVPSLWGKNPDGVVIAEDDHSLGFRKLRLENNVAYAEYRLWFPTNAGNNKLRIAEARLSGFWVSGVAERLSTPYPSGSNCESGSECRSGLCNGVCREPSCGPDPCFDDCVANHGGPLSGGDAYSCAKGCAGMSGGAVADPDKYCGLEPGARYGACIPQCEALSAEKIAVCKSGCEHWNYV